MVRAMVTSCSLLRCMFNDMGGVLCSGVFERNSQRKLCCLVVIDHIPTGYATVAEAKYRARIVFLGQRTCPLTRIKKQCNQKVIACIGRKQVRLLASITSSYFLILILVSSRGVDNSASRRARLRVIPVGDVSKAILKRPLQLREHKWHTRQIAIEVNVPKGTQAPRISQVSEECSPAKKAALTTTTRTSQFP